MLRGLSENCVFLPQGLFGLAHDANAEVRRVVCTGLVQLLAVLPDRVEAVMGELIGAQRKGRLCCCSGCTLRTGAWREGGGGTVHH